MDLLHFFHLNTENLQVYEQLKRDSTSVYSDDHCHWDRAWRKIQNVTIVTRTKHEVSLNGGGYFSGKCLGALFHGCCWLSLLTAPPGVREWYSGGIATSPSMSSKLRQGSNASRMGYVARFLPQRAWVWRDPGSCSGFTPHGYAEAADRRSKCLPLPSVLQDISCICEIGSEVFPREHTMKRKIHWQGF